MEPRHALEAIEIVMGRLEGRTPAVFLDYDGTLTPIVERPDLAVLDEATRAAVRRLAGLCPVAVVSGRARDDVEKLVGLGELVYAGSHGFDIKGPGGAIENRVGAEFVPAVEEAARDLHARLGGIPGVLVEDKTYALAVHFRLVDPARHGEIEAAVDEAARRAGKLRKTGGKMIFELRPKIGWDKGKAVLWLLEVLGLDRPDVMPLYIGDDVTDFDAFRALRGRGIGIYVNDARTTGEADFWLADPSEVRAFLEELAARIETLGGGS